MIRLIENWKTTLDKNLFIGPVLMDLKRSTVFRTTFLLGPIFFNIFLNDLFLYIKKSGIHNFADDNTITACNTLTRLLKTLEQEFESAVNWLKQNKMIVNTDKFQVIILNKKENDA